MPAYWSMEFVFDRADITPDFMRQFYAALRDAGLHFISGYEKPDASLDALLETNQRWLEADYDPDTDEHYAESRQMLFALEGFGELRGFWMNGDPGEHHLKQFCFDLIAPEETVSDWMIFDREKIKAPERLALEMKRCFPAIRYIQTDLEHTEGPLYCGAPPHKFPFAVDEQGNLLHGSCRMLDVRYNEFDADAFISLWNAVWDGTPSKEQVELALANSIFRIGVYDGDRIVGMARMIGDFGMCFYIKDVVVHPEYQKNSIGHLMITHLLRFIRKHGVPGTDIAVELCAMPDKIPFYQKFGFAANEAQRLRIMLRAEESAS